MLSSITPLDPLRDFLDSKVIDASIGSQISTSDQSLKVERVIEDNIPLVLMRTRIKFSRSS